MPGRLGERPPPGGTRSPPTHGYADLATGDRCNATRRSRAQTRTSAAVPNNTRRPSPSPRASSRPSVRVTKRVEPWGQDDAVALAAVEPGGPSGGTGSWCRPTRFNPRKSVVERCVQRLGTPAVTLGGYRGHGALAIAHVGSTATSSDGETAPRKATDGLPLEPGIRPACLRPRGKREGRRRWRAPSTDDPAPPFRARTCCGSRWSAALPSVAPAPTGPPALVPGGPCRA